MPPFVAVSVLPSQRRRQFTHPQPELFDLPGPAAPRERFCIIGRHRACLAFQIELLAVALHLQCYLCPRRRGRDSLPEFGQAVRLAPVQFHDHVRLPHASLPSRRIRLNVCDQNAGAIRKSERIGQLRGELL